MLHHNRGDGEAHNMPTISEATKSRIKELAAKGVPYKDIARELNVGKNTVSKYANPQNEDESTAVVPVSSFQTGLATIFPTQEGKLAAISEMPKATVPIGGALAGAIHAVGKSFDDTLPFEQRLEMGTRGAAFIIQTLISGAEVTSQLRREDNARREAEAKDLEPEVTEEGKEE